MHVARSDAPDIADLPVDMDQSAKKIKRALLKLQPSREDLEAVYAYELSHSSRKTLLAELEKMLARVAEAAKVDEGDEG